MPTTPSRCSDTIPRTAETEELRLRLYRLLSTAALAAWEGDLAAVRAHLVSYNRLCEDWRYEGRTAVMNAASDR